MHENPSTFDCDQPLSSQKKKIKDSPILFRDKDPEFQSKEAYSQIKYEYRKAVTGKSKQKIHKIRNLMKSFVGFLPEIVKIFPEFSLEQLQSIKSMLDYDRKNKVFSLEQQELLFRKVQTHGPRFSYLTKFFPNKSKTELRKEYYKLKTQVYLMDNNNLANHLFTGEDSKPEYKPIFKITKYSRRRARAKARKRETRSKEMKEHDFNESNFKLYQITNTPTAILLSDVSALETQNKDSLSMGAERLNEINSNINLRLNVCLDELIKRMKLSELTSESSQMLVAEIYNNFSKLETDIQISLSSLHTVSSSQHSQQPNLINIGIIDQILSMFKLKLDIVDCLGKL